MRRKARAIHQCERTATYRHNLDALDKDTVRADDSGVVSVGFRGVAQERR